MFSIWSLATVVLAAWTPPGDIQVLRSTGTKGGVLVMDLGGAVSPELKRTISQEIATIVNATGAFEAVAVPDAKPLVSEAQLASILECTDVMCGAGHASRLELAYAINGDVTAQDDGYRLRLHLIEGARAWLVHRAIRRLGNAPNELTDAIQSAAVELRDKLGALKPGRLTVQLQHPDTLLELAGEPLANNRLSKIATPAGAHPLTANLEGYHTAEGLVPVMEHGETLVSVRLRPNANTLQQRMERRELHRILGWSAVGVGGAALVGALWLQLHNADRADRLRVRINEFNQDPFSTQNGADLKQERRAIARNDLFTLGAGAAGIAALMGAWSLLAEEGEPHDHGSLRVAPVPGGVGVGGTF